MKVREETVIDIRKNVETVFAPLRAKYIGEFACVRGMITSLNLEGSNIQIIEQYAFSNCHKLKEVTFPSCLIEICEGAFFNCTWLKFIRFGSDSKLKKIGARAFQYCEQIKKFKFPPLIETIEEFAFNNCKCSFIFDLRNTKVRNISPNTLKSISTVILPATATTKSVINCCKCKLSVDENHAFVKRDECGCLFANGMIINSNKKASRFLIRRGVERIGKDCFYESNLISLTIPSSVTKISKDAFMDCQRLKIVRFAANSRLSKIGKGAFSFCQSLKKISFPKSLKVIKTGAFRTSRALENVSFPEDSQLESVGDDVFLATDIKHLVLPPSIRELHKVCNHMNKLESLYLNNDLFKSNEEKTMVLSKDGSELICAIPSIEKLIIPEGVRVIKSGAITGNDYIFIAASVEVIEEGAFQCYRNYYEFAPGSKLRYLDYSAFSNKPYDIIINNENFVRMENGVVMSLNPRGIIFVPDKITEIEIDPNTEVIYQNAFSHAKIKSIRLPKTLKIISDGAFFHTGLRSITIEEGLDLEYIGRIAFYLCFFDEISFRVNGRSYKLSLNDNSSIELPPDFDSEQMKITNFIFNITKKITCSRSTFLFLAKQGIFNQSFNIIE